MDYVVIIYKNWRGETSERKISPPPGKAVFEIRLDKNSWHQDLCYMFDAFDLDRGSIRSFALEGIQSGSWKIHGVHEKIIDHTDKGSGV